VPGVSGIPAGGENGPPAASVSDLSASNAQTSANVLGVWPAGAAAAGADVRRQVRDDLARAADVSHLPELWRTHAVRVDPVCAVPLKLLGPSHR